MAFISCQTYQLCIVRVTIKLKITSIFLNQLEKLQIMVSYNPQVYGLKTLLIYRMGLLPSSPIGWAVQETSTQLINPVSGE